MKTLDAIKISFLSGLLLIIFSLPTLTATQLIGVLGTSSHHTTLTFTPLSDGSTFTTYSGSSFSVSFQQPRQHQFAKVTNSSDIDKTFTLQIIDPKNFPAGATMFYSGKPLSKLNLNQYNSSVDLVVGPHQTVPLAIDTSKSDPDHGSLTLSLSED